LTLAAVCLAFPAANAAPASSGPSVWAEALASNTTTASPRASVQASVQASASTSIQAGTQASSTLASSTLASSTLASSTQTSSTVASSATALVPNDDLLGKILRARPQADAITRSLQAEMERASALRSGPYEWSVGIGVGRRHSRDPAGLRTRDANLALERPLRLWGKEDADRRLAAAGEERARLEADVGYRELKALFIGHWAEHLRSLALSEGARRNLESARQLMRQAEIRQRVGELAQIDAQLARAELLQAQAQATEALALQTASGSRLKALYPLLQLPERLPETFKGWEDALGGRMKGIPERADAAEAIFAQRNPLVLLSQTRSREQRMLAQRLDLERRPDPTLGGFFLSEASGAQSTIGLGLSIPIPGNFRAATARAAAHLAESSSLGGEETVSILRTDLAARWTAWKLRQSLLGDRWLAAELHRDAAQRSLRAFALGERTVAELVQLQRIADEQYTLALTQSVELLILQAGIAMDLGLIWSPE